MVLHFLYVWYNSCYVFFYQVGRLEKQQIKWFIVELGGIPVLIASKLEKSLKQEVKELMELVQKFVTEF